MSPKQHSPHHDSSTSSFITGAVVGAMVALTFGTEQGRSLAKSLASALKSFSEELTNNSQNPLPQKVSAYQQEFKQSVAELNSNLKHTGQQIIDRLHRPANPPQYFQKDNTSFS